MLRFIFVYCLVSATVLAAGGLRSVDELPVDRFDEYQENTFPPHPWRRLGGEAEGIKLQLSAAAETPFAENKVSGKGLLLEDATATAGKGVGAEYGFRPPPNGKLYLGFDFKYSGNELDFVCVLDGGTDGKGLTLHLGQGGKLNGMAELKPDLWYHLGITVEGDTAFLFMTDVTNMRLDRSSAKVKNSKLVFNGEVKFDAPPEYCRVAFFSNGPDAATGSWALDNVCMGGMVDAPRNNWFAFDQLPRTELLKSKHKVYAYYYIYTSSFGNEDPGLSWYTRTVLNPSLTKQSRSKAGSEMLMRPFPRPPMRQPSLSRRDEIKLAMAEEVRLGIQQGLDGFFADFHAVSVKADGTSWFTENSFSLMDAAHEVDPTFKILPAVYCGQVEEADGKKRMTTPEEYANSEVVKRIARHPATLRQDDGRRVWSMWYTERRTPEWWREVLAIMAKNGYPAVLVAQFNSHGKLKEFSDICYGMAQWGPRQVCDYNWVSSARKLTEVVVFPIAAQDVRTRNCGLWEAENSGLLRNMWRQAIGDGADWAFLNTWSDYTETPMAPSTFIGFVPFDLNAYYIQWFKTGQQPEIVRDRLYYFYRRNHSEAEPAKGTKWKFLQGQAQNEIELLAFLTAPGELSITVNGEKHTRQALAGITSFKVPMPQDKQFVPEFSLSRNGKVIAGGKGRYPVLSPVEFQHMIYSSGVIAPESEER